MSALRQIICQYAEETVGDEQVQRVLEPVIAMIIAGKFGRPVNASWFIIPVLSVILVSAVTVIAAHI